MTKSEIRFPPYRLDLDAERLLHGNRSVQLRPKTFAVLRYLVERPGVLVTKDALLQAVWPGVFVTESTLTKSIREIRLALGDDAHKPKFLETVHRRGFRFLGSAATREAWRPAGWAPPVHPVGREHQLEELSGAFARAAEGSRQVVFLTGEAGIGKTTVLGAFVSSLTVPAARGDLWLGSGLCARRQGAHEPYMPVLEAVANLARGPGGDVVAALLRHHAPSWLVQLPWLTESAELEARRADLVGTTVERMLRMFLHFAGELANRAPLVLAFEDLHWADTGTLDLVAALAQRTEHLRLLLIGTYRPAEAIAHASPLEPLRRELGARRRCISVPLDPWPRASVERYLAERYGDAVPTALAHLLCEHTDGHPLYLVTALHHLEGLGLICATPGGLAVSGEMEAIAQAIPKSLRELVETLVTSMRPEEVETLEAASIIGVDFELPILSAALTVPESEAEAVCERLVRSQRFLRGPTEHAKSSVGTLMSCYTFRHGLYQRVFYGRIPLARRRALHRRVGQALEEAARMRGGGAGAEIAAHFERGGDRVRAIHHLLSAARCAAARFADRDVADCLRRALELLAEEPDSATRRRQEVAMRCQLASAMVALGGYFGDEAQRDLTRACQLAADEADAIQVFRLRYVMLMACIGRGDGPRAEELSTQLERDARDLGIEAAGQVAAFSRSYVAVYSGQYEAAEALATVRRLDPQALTGFFYGANPVVIAGGADGSRLWLTGRADQAAAVVVGNVARARTMLPRLNLTLALLHAALIHVWRGECTVASAFVDEGRAIAEEFGYAMWHAAYVGVGGMVAARQGDLDLAAEALEGAMQALRNTSHAVIVPMFLAELADVDRQGERFSEGLTHADAGLALLRSQMDFTTSAELWRVKGDLLLASGRPQDEAEICYVRALAIARDQGSLAAEVRVARSLARLLSEAGRGDDGRSLLDAVVGRFREGFDTTDLVAARTLLDSLGG